MQHNILKALQEIDVALFRNNMSKDVDTRAQLISYLTRWARELGYYFTSSLARAGDLYEFRCEAARARVLKVDRIDGNLPDDYVYFTDGSCSKQRYMTDVKELSSEDITHE